MKILAAFGKSVRIQREKLQISQEELAFRCGLHRTYIGSIERGERNLSLLNIFKICKALEIKPDTLFKDVLKYVEEKNLT